MFEPLLEVTIPDSISDVRQSYQARDPNAEKLIIVLQAYTDVLVQQNIFHLCKLLANNGGVRLIAVEGANKQLTPDPLRPSISQMVGQSSKVSAGVLSLLNDSSASIAVWGVDELDLVAHSTAIMNYLGMIRQVRERFFSAIRPLVREAQRKLYPPPLARLRSEAVFSNVKQQMSIFEQVALLKETAMLVHLDMRDFPALVQIDELKRMEKQVNLNKSQKQRKEFVSRLLGRLSSWYEIVGKNQVRFDLQEALPILRYWASETGQTEDEFYENLKQRGAWDMFSSCQHWMLEKLVLSAKQLEMSDKTELASYVEDLMRMALLLGLDYFDLLDFRKYVAYQRRWGECYSLQRRLALGAEVIVCSQALIDKLQAEKASQLFEIEEQLASVYRNIRLEAGPLEAETISITSGQLTPLLEQLSNIAGMSFPNVANSDLTVIDESIDKAHDFTECSRHRGLHMIEKTLELIRRRGDDRAVLVIGGFHEQIILRVLEEMPQISWSLLMPKIDVKQIKETLGR